MQHTYLRSSVGVRTLRGVPLGRARGGIVVDLTGSALLVPSCKQIVLFYFDHFLYRYNSKFRF